MRHINKMIVVLLVFAVSLPYLRAFEAVASMSTRQELESIREQVARAGEAMDLPRSQLAELSDAQQELMAEISELDARIAQMNHQLLLTRESFHAVMLSLEYTESNIYAAIAEIGLAKEALMGATLEFNRALQAMQVDGPLSTVAMFISALGGAKSLSDFLLRLEGLRMIAWMRHEALVGLEIALNRYETAHEVYIADRDAQRILVWQIEEDYRVYRMLRDELVYEAENRNAMLADIIEDANKIQALLDIKEQDHYALESLLGDVQLRFDRENEEMRLRQVAQDIRAAEGEPAVPPTRIQPVLPPVAAVPGVGAGAPAVVVPIPVPDVGAGAPGIVAPNPVPGVGAVPPAVAMPSPGAGALAAAAARHARADYRAWNRARLVSPRVDRFAWPVPQSMHVSDFYGPVTNRTSYIAYHHGIDIVAVEGAPIVAAADGVVVFSGMLNSGCKYVIIRHDDGHSTHYAHNLRNHVAEGQRVSRGDLIAEVGRTGSTQFAHLHFEVRTSSGARVDPMLFFGR